jgi:putative Mg2+ transporter-C (MgtC) family protein
MITPDDLEMILRLLAALAAGSLIGLERTYHGRPAGFRTHALVCTASSLLMLVTVYEAYWVRDGATAINIDPTRMAQGIMTGIGFLGAGAILKDGYTVRGLTTAASVWMTAAIGILAGIGFYLPLVASVVITLGVLSLFRHVEVRMPSQAYYHLDIRFRRGDALNEAALRTLIQQHGFSIANLSYGLHDEGKMLRHNMVIRTTDRTSAARLAATLESTEPVLEFRIAPTGD